MVAEFFAELQDRVLGEDPSLKVGAKDLPILHVSTILIEKKKKNVKAPVWGSVVSDQGRLIGLKAAF